MVRFILTHICAYRTLWQLDAVVSSAVMVLKRLVQVQLASTAQQAKLGKRTGYSPLEIVAHLARRIDDIRHPQARACVVWLVGQYAGVDAAGMISDGQGAPGGLGRIAPDAPDVLRKLAKSFAGESSLVKSQVVNLAGKLVVLCDDREGIDVDGNGVQEKIRVLARYVFSLARYDRDWDVRDRGRLVGALVGSFILDGDFGSDRDLQERVGVVLRREQVKVVLFEGKDVGKDLGKSPDEENLGVVGSFGRVGRVGGGVVSYFGEEILPDWLERGVESSLRDADEGEGILLQGMSGFGSGVVGGKSPLPLHGQEKVVLIPTGNVGVNGSGSSTPAGSLRGPWTDLDAFYKDADPEEGKGAEEDEEDEEESEEEDENKVGEDPEDIEISPPLS